MTPHSPAPGRAVAPDPEVPTDPVGDDQNARLGDGALADLVDDEREPTMDTTPERALAEQAARTDVALAAWRDESARRGAAFAERHARETAAAAAHRKQVFTGGALVAVGALLAVVLGGAWLAAAPPASHPAPARLLARPAPEARSAPVAAARPAGAAPTAVPPEATPAAEPSAEAPAVAPPTGTAPATAKAARGSTIPPAAAPAAPAASAVTGEDGPAVRDVRVGASAEWAWTEFATTSTGSVQIRWRDGAGQPALDPMGCGGPAVDGARTCKASRSARRIESALAAGAAPGRWTVEACLGAACTDLGAFTAPLGAR